MLLFTVLVLIEIKYDFNLPVGALSQILGQNVFLHPFVLANGTEINTHIKLPN